MEQNLEKAEKMPMVAGPRGLELKDIDAMWRLAQFVAESGFAPKGMEKPASILVAIEMGMELGLPPMQAIQNIAVINGRPSIWGDSAKALVEACGLCVQFDEWFEQEGDENTMKAVCEVRRLARNPVRWEFSVADARRARLWSKEGPWTFYPRRMLQMRARSFAMRDAFPDVLRGIGIVEEIRDIIDITPTVERGVLSPDDFAPAEPESETEPLPGAVVDPETGEVGAAVPPEPKPEAKKAPTPQPSSKTREGRAIHHQRVARFVAEHKVPGAVIDDIMEEKGWPGKVVSFDAMNAEQLFYMERRIKQWLITEQGAKE